jgi:hypothetical protein
VGMCSALLGDEKWIGDGSADLGVQDASKVGNSGRYGLGIAQPKEPQDVIPHRPADKAAISTHLVARKWVRGMRRRDFDVEFDSTHTLNQK